jgi:hypothetical protein
VILSSLKRSGFDMSKVAVVVGGYSGEKTDFMEGARVVWKQSTHFYI